MNRCPVNETIVYLRNAIESGMIQSPKYRREMEEILEVLEDIAWGRAGEEHIPALERKSRILADQNEDRRAFAVGATLLSVLSEKGEVFESHVQTHNCAVGECVRLSPAPCQMACPAGIDVPAYVSLIGMGRDDEAIDVIRQDNPFPWVCGLVCTRPCEFMCVRGRIDKPISIKFLKAFAAERALSERKYRNPEKAADKDKKVCVVGAGPGGMSAAYFLALKGYRVTVLEALPMAGGMMMVGIPRYRLPREVIDREVAMIADLGVEFRFNTRFGGDVTMESLKEEGFEAFFFAIGAHKAFNLNIPGEQDFESVLESVEFLKRAALGDRRSPGKRVVVIGGGNVAIDAARTSLRMGAEKVTIAYRRTRDEMPADVEEVEQAEQEGIEFSFLTVPTEVVGESGELAGLKCLRAELVVKEGSERKYPVPIKGSDFVIEADAVISAIGQRVDHECLAGVKDLKWTRRMTIDVNGASMETQIPGVFAAGDAVTGPATVVEAIGGGKRAAEAIDRYLCGLPQPKMPPVPVRRMRTEWTEVPAAAKMTLKRPKMPLLNVDRRRTTFQQVELGYSENQVREEARRCLRCDVCLRCGKCVETCKDKMGVDALALGYLDFDHPVETDFRTTRDRCILCGACAAECPNDAMRVVHRNGQRLLSLCGTILNRDKILYCESCGECLGTQKYLRFVNERLADLPTRETEKKLCGKCARKGAALAYKR